MICTKCQEDKDSSEFYKGRKQCKKCHNKPRTTRPGYKAKKKKTGFAKLPAETQASILEELLDHTMKSVAAAHGIKYATFRNWKKKGFFDQPDAQTVVPSEAGALEDHVDGVDVLTPVLSD